MVTRLFARAAMAALLLASLGLGSTAHAVDDPPKPPSDDGGQGPSQGTGDSTDSGGTAYGQEGDCSIVSSPSYLGMACAGGTWNRRSIREILDGDKLPGCWHDPMTPAEVEAMMLSTEGGVTWYWYRCLKGIDPVTLKIGDDGVTFTTGIVSVKDPGQVIHLTKNQEELVDFYDKDGQIPSPVAGVSPMANPRVGAWVSYFDGTDGVVEVSVDSVILRGTVTSLDVEPEGTADPTLHCDGTGYKAQRGDTPFNTNGGCWHQYARSSAAQPDQRYPVNMTAHWVVEVSSNGGATWSVFNEFDKSQITTIPVTEIEALVVR